MSTSFEPIRIYFYWDCDIKYDSGMPYFDGPAKKCWVLRRQISYSELVSKVCGYRNADSSRVQLNFQLRVPILFRGYSNIQYTLVVLEDDDDLENLWNLPSEVRNGGIGIFVHMEPIVGGFSPSFAFNAREEPTYNDQSQIPNTYPTYNDQSQIPNTWPTYDDQSQVPNTYPTYDDQDQSQVPNTLPGSFTSLLMDNMGYRQEIPSFAFVGMNESTSSNSNSTSMGTTSRGFANDPVTPMMNRVPFFETEEAPISEERDDDEIRTDMDDEDEDWDREPNDDSDSEDYGNEDEEDEIQEQPIPQQRGVPIPQQRSGASTSSSVGMRTDYQNSGCFSDQVGSGEHVDDEFDIGHVNIRRWVESDDPTLRIGMSFANKDQAIYAVRLWNIKCGREFRVIKSKSKVWTAECKNKSQEHPCNWYVRIILKQSSAQWEITVLEPEHTCLMRVVNNSHRNLTHKNIARQITHLVRNDPEIPVSAIQEEVKKMFLSACSYKKGWYARKAVIEMLYGKWSETFQILPRYMMALQDANPGTIVRWKHHDSSIDNDKVFRFMFWSFQASRLGYNHCRPIISVDGTFLRGAYKGVLLIANTWDANNHILPLAFAIVDEESRVSWSWFLILLRRYVVPERNICLISDRHKGILSAINSINDLKPPRTIHRYCLRHVRANFKVIFKRKELTELMYKAGMESKVTKFNEIMQEIKRRNVDAFNYLDAIDVEKWTLSHDGGHRYGCMTTNLSESLNSVLKKCRALPLKALVEYTYTKLVQYFSQRRDDATHTRHPFPSVIWKKYVANEKKSRGHNIVEYNHQLGIYSVRTPLRGDGKGNHYYTVKIREHSCTCQKWSIFGIPCSHVFAVCRHRGLDPTTFVLDFFSKTKYRLIYQGNLYPVANESLWNDPDFTLKHYPPNMKGNHPGRQRTRRYRCSMDARDPDSPPRCGNCHRSGHNRRTCANQNPSTSYD